MLTFPSAHAEAHFAASQAKASVTIATILRYIDTARWCFVYVRAFFERRRHLTLIPVGIYLLIGVIYRHTYTIRKLRKDKIYLR